MAYQGDSGFGETQTRESLKKPKRHTYIRNLVAVHTRHGILDDVNASVAVATELEAKRPVRHEVEPSDGAGVLLDDGVRLWPEEDIHVQDTSDCLVDQAGCRCEGHVLK